MFTSSSLFISVICLVTNAYASPSIVRNRIVSCATVLLTKPLSASSPIMSRRFPHCHCLRTQRSPHCLCTLDPGACNTLRCLALGYQITHQFGLFRDQRVQFDKGLCFASRLV